MTEEDLKIYEYRMEKEKKFASLIKKEKLEGRSEKVSFYSTEAGYIDGYLYRPKTYHGETSLPMIFNFHGGGMVLGYCEQDGPYCQRIADEVYAAVINVDYPIAPEFKFPVPILASYTFMSELVQAASTYHLDATKVFTMGHSAGGYISAALCVLDAQQKRVNLKGLIADYAVLKQDQDPSLRQTIDPNKAIPVSRMQQYYHWYFHEDDDASHVLASPINANPAIFPTSLIISAEFDALKEEELAFANALKNAGVDVTYQDFKNCMHGFTHDCFDEYNEEEAERAWNLMIDFLKKATKNEEPIYETIDSIR